MALSSPGAGTAAAANDTSASSGPGPGLLPLLPVGNSAMYALYVGVADVLLALQVEDIDPANNVANFGLITGVSAVFATVFNPVAGALSDRSGRRNPWILGGGLAAVPALLLPGFADRVPMGARGKASAAVFDGFMASLEDWI
ncbi:hypothetical protein [Streptomyces sp. NPDC006463]|uniref:hypothetical protein n=1 Tax=Streptomyces sp. NPDC006463 TaxID=3364746 RepID=UPI00368155F3